MQIEVQDEFVEYPMGYVKYAYSGDCIEARTHQSGWAARNANNHNQVFNQSISIRLTEVVMQHQRRHEFNQLIIIIIIIIQTL